MIEADALDIVQYAIWTVLTACGPAVAVAMLVGVGIAGAGSQTGGPDVPGPT